MISKRLFILFLFVALAGTPFSALALGVGEPAPELSLKTVAGQTVSLADFKGRVVLVKLSTTWCPTCKELSAELDEVSDYLHERNAVVLEVFVQDTAEMITKAVAKTSYPEGGLYALIDDGSAYRAYGVYLIPRLVIIDQEQTVRFDSVGQVVTGREIQRVIDRLVPADATPQR